MRCTKCPHFRIAQRPIHLNGDIVDTGLARCKKHDLVVDFFSKRKLNKLVCIDEMETGICDLYHAHGYAETWFCADGERREVE